MERNGQPIWEHPLRHRVETGIEYVPLADGYVSEYEQREAAVYCHYTPLEFGELPLGERARAVAQYRLHGLVEAHQQDAINQAMDRQAQRRG